MVRFQQLPLATYFQVARSREEMCLDLCCCILQTYQEAERLPNMLEEWQPISVPPQGPPKVSKSSSTPEIGKPLTV